MFGWGKKPEMAAEFSEDHFESVKQALEGNFDLVKPFSCQRPWCGPDETYPLQYTENQQNTSILNTDTDAYNTASSTDLSLEENIDMAAITKQSQCKVLDDVPNVMELIPLPEKTNNIHYHQNQDGKFRRFRSDVAWEHAGNDQQKNNVNCFDCAAQFSTYDMPTTEAGSTSIPQTSTCAPYSHTPTQTSCQEETTLSFEAGDLNIQSGSEEVTQSASTIKDLRKSSPHNNNSHSTCDSSNKVCNKWLVQFVTACVAQYHAIIKFSLKEIIFTNLTHSAPYHIHNLFVGGFNNNGHWSCDY